jgi:hypothetical protein
MRPTPLFPFPHIAPSRKKFLDELLPHPNRSWASLSQGGLVGSQKHENKELSSGSDFLLHFPKPVELFHK